MKTLSAVALMVMVMGAVGAQEEVIKREVRWTPTSGINLARGKACAFTPAPNYGLCTDAGDATDLTDGLYNACEWREKGTVGWGVGRTKVFLVDIDLGTEAPIGAITFDSVTGGAQVTFPSAVLAFVSSDGKQYRHIGDVMTEAMPQEQFLNHRFSVTGLKAYGRYVRLAILPGGFYLFCDEIEVMKGDHTAEQSRYAGDEVIAAEEVANFAVGLRPWVNQKNATLTLLRYADEAVLERRQAGAPSGKVQKALEATERARQEVLRARDVQEPDLLAGPPYRSFERGAFAAVGALNGPAGIRLWRNDDWSWLKPLARPQRQLPELAVDMMNNEWGSASFNVTSCGEKAQELQFEVADFTGPQKLAAGQVLSLAQVIHSEAFGYNYRDDALVPVKFGGKISLPAGLSRRLWVTSKTRGMDLNPGIYRTAITVTSDGKKVGQVPVRLRVWPLRFPDQTTLHNNTWGYFNEKVIVGRELETAQNLLDHYNTSLVINHSYLPYPKPDKDGNFTEPLDFTKLDQMIAWNPECRFWLLWAGFEFGFDRLGTPKFGGPVWEKVFTQWVTQIRDHLATKGIGKGQFAWYWWDEPGAKVWNEKCLPAAKLVKQIDPQMLCYENAVAQVTPQMLEEALPYFDLYCPSIGGIANRKYVEVCRKTRVPSWVYACASEKNSSPFGYYRWFSWNAFKLGFGGIGMWVYVDANSQTLSDYTGGVSYSLIYGSPKGILNSKRWEAWRQGVADYEYLVMLRSAAEQARQAGKAPEAVAQAEKILTAGVDEVVGEDIYQGDPAASPRAEAMRLKILECLVALSK